MPNLCLFFVPSLTFCCLTSLYAGTVLHCARMNNLSKLRFRRVLPRKVNQKLRKSYCSNLTNPSRTPCTKSVFRKGASNCNPTSSCKLLRRCGHQQSWRWCVPLHFPPNNTNIRTHAHRHANTHIYICVYTCICAFTYVYMYLCVYLHPTLLEQRHPILNIFMFTRARTHQHMLTQLCR